MAATASPERRQSLQSVEIHSVLSNERRQMTLELLRKAGEPMSARELSERIAERETGENPPPRNIRQSAYVSLHQTHLPKLDELDVVEYDDSSKTVSLSSSADQVSDFMGNEPNSPPDRYYLIVSLAGLLSVAVSMVAPSGLGSVIGGLLAGAFFAVGAGLAAYRLFSAGR